MTKEELKEQFSSECTETDTKGRTVVKGTPMDIINWIAEKFCLSDVSVSLPDQYPDNEADGYVFCGKCGKMKEC